MKPKGLQLAQDVTLELKFETFLVNENKYTITCKFEDIVKEKFINLF